MQHGTFDSPGPFLIRTIVFDIDGRCRSILLADSTNASRVTIGQNLFFENLWTERTLAEGVMEDGLGRTEQITLRERLFL